MGDSMTTKTIDLAQVRNAVSKLHGKDIVSSEPKGPLNVSSKSMESSK